MSTDDELENDPDIIAFRLAQKKARGGAMRNAARLVAAFAIAAGVGLGLFSFIADAAHDDAQDRAARLDRGETVVVLERPGDPARGAVGVALLSVFVGSLAFVGSYRLLGGKIDADTMRAMKEMLTGRR